MVEELERMGIKLMVSVWPTVDPYSENYAEMKQKGGISHRSTAASEHSITVWERRSSMIRRRRKQNYMYEKLKKNYGQYGIEVFWLDEAEPEFQHYDFDNYRFRMGAAQEVAGIYPICYIRALYDGQVKDGVEDRSI